VRAGASPREHFRKGKLMKKRKNIFSSIAILALAAAATPLYSTTLEYSSRAAWTAAVSAITTTTFDTASGGYTPPPPDGILNITLGGITLDGIKYQVYNGTAENAFNAINGGPAQTYYNWGSGAILQAGLYSGALAHLHMTLPGAVTAWGVDLMINGASGGTFTVQVNGGACLAATCSAPTFLHPTRAFYGMTSDTAFSIVDLYYPANTYGEIDNFSIATFSAGPAAPEQPTGETPELATILLCATGLIGMAKSRKIRSLTLA
jgi:hypothetical protein